MPVAKRGIWAALVLGATLGTAFGGDANAAAPADGSRKYVITRNGSNIGTHTIRFQSSSKGLVIKHEVRVLVKVLFVTAYRYESDRTETWENDHLLSFRAQTNDNGTSRNVVATRVGEGIEVRGEAGTLKAPDTALPSLSWNVLANGSRKIIDADSGKLLDVTVSSPEDELLTLASGKQIKCQRLRVSGAQEATLWFGPDGAIVKERLKARDGSWVQTIQE
jgi:hypothetical protein